MAKAMRREGIRARTAKKRRIRTTDSRHDHPLAPNRLERNFSASGPNRVWVCDITYVSTEEGFLFLAGILDVHGRMIVGWSMAEHMRAEMVADALRMAIARRDPPQGLVHHSDQGVQYACGDYRSLAERHGMLTSMSRVGDCYDNAMKESFWATLKKKLV